MSDPTPYIDEHNAEDLPPLYLPAPAIPEHLKRPLSRLPLQSPIRRLAEAIAERKRIPSDCIAPVADALAAPDKQPWKHNLISVWTIGRAAGPADRHAAAGWLCHVLEKWPQLDGWPRLRRSYLRTLMLTYIIVGEMLLDRGGPLPGGLVALLFAGPFMSLPLCLLAYPFSSWLDRRRLNRIRAEAAAGLGLLRVPYSVTELALSLYDGDANVRAASRESLAAVLPAVTPELYGRLSLETTPRLCNLLNDVDPRMVIDVLVALRNVGDSRAVRPVERLLRSNMVRGNQHIFEAAYETHKVLLQRQKREDQAASLLRPTSSPVEPAQALMRAYVNTGENAQEALLRATEE